MADLETELVGLAETLSRGRRQTAGLLETAMAAELDSLAFQHPQFEVRFLDENRDISAVRSSGWGRVEFFF
ncbi:DNA repair protein RecN, partial [bacterium]|nr:DNA repair protein RecN [bacterium]